jgi:hypothetical protein
MCASLCDSFTISAYDFRLHLSPQFGILQFHLYRRNDFTLSRLPMLRFHPRLRFGPAIGLTMSTRDFDVRFRRAKTCNNMRFWPAMGPAICAAGLPLAFAADSSIRNRRIDRLPWASIPACDDFGTCDSQSLQDFIVALRFSTILRSITEVITADVFSCICGLFSAFNLATISLRTAHICGVFTDSIGSC